MKSTVTIESKKQTNIMHLDGTLDAYNAANVKDKFQELEGNHPTRVILDLKNVSFIDSAGIGVIISLYRRLKEKNCACVLAHVHGQPQYLIEMLQLDRILPQYANLEEAMDGTATG